MTDPGLDDLRRAIETLEAIAGDRSRIALFPEELVNALMSASARVAFPGKIDRAKVKKARREEELRRREELDRAARAGVEIRVARRAPVFAAPGKVGQEETLLAPERRLATPRYCYVCKTPFMRLHFFYDSMCQACGDFNYRKRFESAPLTGRTALITGARLKIGYQASLKMLRAGARVIATTRFPKDAAVRYSREADFPAWKERLEVHGLDLRHTPSVELFARYLDHTLDRLDILVNNAAQTVRRPPAFYAHLLETEAKPSADFSPEVQGLLRRHEDCKASLVSGIEAAPKEAADATGLAPWHAGGLGVGIRLSASLSQIKYSFDDAERGLDLFPEGKTDADLQQVDLRSQNSWRMTLAEVPTAEMLELQLINSVAPFVLCARLKPLMLRDKTGEKHVVNVSAMEGSFSRKTKTDKHPHTNMAKAALNMLTLTSAPDYVKDGIHMNAVDTGWVTDEDPALHAARKKDELDFQPPLDIVDGAARVCDPFFSGLISGEHVWGKFLKDYKPTEW